MHSMVECHGLPKHYCPVQYGTIHYYIRQYPASVDCSVPVCEKQNSLSSPVQGEIGEGTLFTQNSQQSMDVRQLPI